MLSVLLFATLAQASVLVIMYVAGSTALHIAASTSKEPKEQGFARVQLSEKFGMHRKPCNAYRCLPVEGWWEMTTSIHFYKQELDNKYITNSIFVRFSITSAIAVLLSRQKWCQRVTVISCS